MTDKEKELQAEAIGYYRKRITELEMTVGTLRNFSNEQATCIERLEKENAELKKLKRECETSLCRAEYQYNYEQLTKAKELLKDITSSYGSTEVSEAQLYLKIKKAEQFLKGEDIILEDAQAGNSPFDADEVFNKGMKAYPEEK